MSRPARQVLEALTRRLASAGVPSPSADARWLLLHALGWSAADLTLSTDRPLTAAQLRAVTVLADRRAAREPLQLIVGCTSFRGHTLVLRPGVFIPRPETELLVDLVLAAAPEGGVVVETCAGSGAVACAVAAERSDLWVLAVDRDPAAVALTRENADRLGVAVDARAGDLLDAVSGPLWGQVDVVTANPPYLATDEVETLEPEVADWDPPHALVAGPTGHEVSDALIASAPAHLRPGGWLLLELDERRVAEAASRARQRSMVDVGTRTDLTGRPRFVVARRPR